MNNLPLQQHSIINTAGIDIANTADFAKFVALSKLVESQLKEAWGIVEQQMLDRGIAEVKGDWGKVSFVERMNWKAGKDLDPYYLKTAPDTKKLKAAFDANELPVGADFTTTVYIKKAIK